MTGEEIERFRRGDSRLFQQCVEQESPRLLAYALRLTGDRDAAEDLVQDTWIHAYRKREAYAGSGSLFGWLLTICRSLHLSARRTEARRNEREQAESVDGLHGSGGPGAVQMLERTDLRRRIAEALGDLPPQQRDVLVLRLLEDRSTRETAERLGIAQGTVKATLHHAIQHMRTLLGETER